jgi:hypothetical protein
MSNPKRKRSADFANEGVAEQYPPLSEDELLHFLMFLDEGDLRFGVGDKGLAERTVIAVETYMDIIALTTVESIAERPRPIRDLPDAILDVRWALLIYLERFRDVEAYHASSAQEEDDE